MSIASIDNYYKQQLDTTQVQAARNANALGLDGTQPVWMTAATGFTAPLWDGKVFSIGGTTGMGAAFNRDALNEAYLKAIQTAGEVGGGRQVDRMVAKTQGSYLEMMERAFRERHKSPIRGFMHQQARQAAHGSDNSAFVAARNYLENMLASGYSDPATPEEAGIVEEID